MELDRLEPEPPISAPASGAAIMIWRPTQDADVVNTRTWQRQLQPWPGTSLRQSHFRRSGCIPANRRHRDVERLSPAGTSIQEMVRRLPERAVSAGRDSNLLKMIWHRAACSKSACTRLRGTSICAPSLTRRWLSRSSALQQPSMASYVVQTR